MSRRSLMLLISGAAVALAGLVPYRSDLGWIDPVTGSMKVQERCFLIPVATVVQTSAIERWILRHEGRYSNTWRFLHDTSSSLIGGRCRACSVGPEIYPLHAGALNEYFVSRSSDAEIAEFVRIMREGTIAEKERAVDLACQ